LTIRRAHGEAARRHYHHLGALSAFLEAVLRLQHPFLGRGQRRCRLPVGGDNHFEFDDVSGVTDRVWQDVSILVAGVADDERYPAGHGPASRPGQSPARMQSPKQGAWSIPTAAPPEALHNTPSARGI